MPAAAAPMDSPASTATKRPHPLAAMGRSAGAAPDPRPSQHRSGSPLETGYIHGWSRLISNAIPPPSLRRSLPFSAPSFTQPLHAHGLHLSRLSKLGEWEIEFKTIKAEIPHAFHIHFAALEIET
ncbi:hypothetical protein M422DRAFT_243752 [Sphaerobolus stellatus SS14]|nr:hypothetical protein M422DRAFT_243669 [Sphaerobolus stellatus SS14]KIJ52155.1 hypothetical protein M422DRAFT_243752 [Sphaerobolus stellatus SS14]